MILLHLFDKILRFTPPQLQKAKQWVYNHGFTNFEHFIYVLSTRTVDVYADDTFLNTSMKIKIEHFILWIHEWELLLTNKTILRLDSTLFNKFRMDYINRTRPSTSTVTSPMKSPSSINFNVSNNSVNMNTPQLTNIPDDESQCLGVAKVLMHIFSKILHFSYTQLQYMKQWADTYNISTFKDFAYLLTCREQCRNNILLSNSIIWWIELFLRWTMGLTTWNLLLEFDHAPYEEFCSSYLMNVSNHDHSHGMSWHTTKRTNPYIPMNSTGNAAIAPAQLSWSVPSQHSNSPLSPYPPHFSWATLALRCASSFLPCAACPVSFPDTIQRGDMHPQLIGC
jgi:hypothetical protein